MIGAEAAGCGIERTLKAADADNRAEDLADESRRLIWVLDEYSAAELVLESAVKRLLVRLETDNLNDIPIGGDVVGLESGQFAAGLKIHRRIDERPVASEDAGAARHVRVDGGRCNRCAHRLCPGHDAEHHAASALGVVGYLDVNGVDSGGRDGAVFGPHAGCVGFGVDLERRYDHGPNSAPGGAGVVAGGDCPAGSIDDAQPHRLVAWLRALEGDLFTRPTDYVIARSLGDHAQQREEDDDAGGLHAPNFSPVPAKLASRFITSAPVKWPRYPCAQARSP